MKVTKLSFIPATMLVLLAGCGKEAASPEPAPPAAAEAPAAAPATDSAAVTPVTAPPPAAAGASAAAIASAEGETPGVRLDVTELKRSAGGTVNLKFNIVNGSSERLGFGYDFVEKDMGYGDIGGVHLIDPVGKKKYFVARDSEGNCVCSRGLKDLDAGSTRSLWAKFPAPPPEVKTISIVVPHFSPLDDVPISE